MLKSIIAAAFMITVFTIVTVGTVTMTSEQAFAKKTDKEKMRDLEIMIRQVPQNGLILTREFGKEGFPRRQDHLIFVSNQNNLNILLSKIDDSQEIRWI